MARKPLMAGNWKMNNNHLEAIALVQKLAFALKDKDYEAVDIAVLPPFTDLRSVQTLVDADRLKIAYGSQDISAHASGALTPVAGRKFHCSFCQPPTSRPRPGSGGIQPVDRAM